MPRVMPEDLINAVIAADDLRRRALGLPSTRAADLGRGRPFWTRVFIEPFFNLLGLAWGQLMFFMPWVVRKPYVQWVNCKMGRYSSPASPDLPKRIDETVRLAKELQQKTGQWPALLVLTSHPDTEGPLQWLRFELMRQGLQIADRLVEARKPGAWYPSHPRCLLAIDPFALDTVSPAVGAFYAAWMRRIYIAWDRQPSTQSWIRKHILLIHSGYVKIVWRLLQYLKADIPVVMVLSGGLPYNARLLYAAREFVQQLPIARWKIPKRKAQIELMEILMKPEGDVWPSDKGDLPSGHIQAIRDALARWGLSTQQMDSALKEFQEEFKRSVPYRTRLFRVLINRLVKRGKPLILVAVSHRDMPPHVRVGSPAAVYPAPEDVKSFAQSYVRTNF